MANNDFCEATLPEAIKGFTKALEAGISYLNNLELKLDDDKKIKDKKDLLTIHGRYFFLREGVWESDYIPCAESPGVYFFFNNDKDRKALYVGKSEKKIGDRIGSHGRDYKNYEKNAPEYVIVVPLEKEISFLAPAFESYLLERYAFEHNTQKNK